MHDHCEIFLNMFRAAAAEGQPVYTADLAKLSRNHTARISNLRAAGHVITCAAVPEGDARYGPKATMYWYHGPRREAERFAKQVTEITKLLDRIRRLDFSQQIVLVQAVVKSHPGREAAFSLAA